MVDAAQPTARPGGPTVAAAPPSRTGRGRLPRELRLLLGGGAALAFLALLTILRSVTVTPTSGSTPGAGSATGSAAASAAGPGPGASVEVGRFLVAASPAPDLRLTDADGQPFDLSRDRGAPTFVFFGYTHCPDVCPATVGTIGQTMERFGAPTHAVFVTVDPERDTTTWLRQYRQYLERGFETLTGTPAEIARAAADWGVRYAKVESGTPGAYSMSHTADVWLLDGAGTIRAKFPFGTSTDEMLATLRSVALPSGASGGSSEPPAASAAATPTPATTSSPAPTGALAVTVISSSVWAGPQGPVILDLTIGGARIDDPSLRPVVQVVGVGGAAQGGPVAAVAVQPPGETRVLYVPTVAFPTTGWWRLDVSLERGGIAFHGSADVAVLDPGVTAAIGSPAPTAHTPTLSDVGGVAKAVTTDPAPDLRLSQTSTTDALAAHRPFVLVVDSWKFRVTSACGKALVMARYLVDRWPSDAFIHLEPLRYDVVTETPVLEGSLGDPTLTDPAAAWGLVGGPWSATDMPWVFVVDGNGIVRAKAEGVMGTDDVDVILAMLAAGG